MEEALSRVARFETALNEPLPHLGNGLHPRPRRRIQDAVDRRHDCKCLRFYDFGAEAFADVCGGTTRADGLDGAERCCWCHLIERLDAAIRDREDAKEDERQRELGQSEAESEDEVFLEASVAAEPAAVKTEIGCDRLLHWVTRSQKASP